MSIKNKKITVNSPATIANLGPGFDSIGASVDIWNNFEFIFDTDTTSIQIEGEGKSVLPNDNTNLVYKSFSLLFDHLNINIPNINLKVNNSIKLERGLGSSSSAISAGIIAANYYLKNKFSKLELIKISQKLEPHLDNISPCIMGGIQLCIKYNNDILLSNLEFDNDLKIILVIPSSTTNTQESRSLLPDSISIEDFVHNMSRFGLLIKNLKSPIPEESREAFKDVFHQNHRILKYPKLKHLLNRINDVGALGSFVCGSGPTIGAITNTEPMTIFYEIADYCDKQSIDCDFLITKITKKGSYIKE